MVRHSELGDMNYGYVWWILDDGAYLALGTDGQSLLIDPIDKLVFVDRVDTGDELRRKIRLFLGTRMNAAKFLQLVGMISSAKPADRAPTKGPGPTSSALFRLLRSSTFGS